MMGSGVDAGPSRPGAVPPSLISTPKNGNGNINSDHPWKPLSDDTSKMNKIRDIVDTSVSATRKGAIEAILQQIEALSPGELLLLYLKLPTGRTADPDPLKQPLNPLGSRSEVQLTKNWIKTHLQIDSDISLFKEDVYKEYLNFCRGNVIKPLSKADFGKMMKQVFPAVKARRLGQRGDSKYTYSGLTKKSAVSEPELPDLSESSCEQIDDASEQSACTIVLEWAEKMGNVKCSTIKDLALQLINKNVVDTRSEAASTLLSEQRPDSSIGKHQLQRKLQEKEQKRKLQEVPVENNRLKTRRRTSMKTPALTPLCTSKISPKNTNSTFIGSKPNGNVTRNGNYSKIPIKRESVDDHQDPIELDGRINGPKFGYRQNGVTKSVVNYPVDKESSKIDFVVNGKPEWNFNTHIEDLNPDNSFDASKYVKPGDELRASTEDQNIMQLKKFLTETICASSNPGTDDFVNGNQIAEQRRRVSFQSPNTQMACPPFSAAEGAVDSKNYQFRAINQQQNVSQSSSANQSPFTSPTATPMQRSRNNSGQTSSSYMTPRSTTFTPDMAAHSENGTPFMSPVPTPQRSRHPSFQSRPMATIQKARHSSANLSFRVNPYDSVSNRRKIRQRTFSGNNAQSAPMSPLVHDQFANPPDDFSMQYHADTNNQSKRTLFGINPYDQRRRHASAGPIVAFQTSQSNYFPTQTTQSHQDPLDLELTASLANQHWVTQSTNRPNSVPLPQLTPQDANAVAKSYPSTPVFNHQFDFGQDCISQPSSYTVTPVPSEYSDFQACSNLDINAMTDEPTDPNLSNIDPSLSADISGRTAFGSLMQYTEYNDSNRFNTQQSFMQNVGGVPFSTTLNRSNESHVDPQITLNALNAPHTLDISFNANGSLDEDFSNTLDDLELALEPRD